MGKTYRKSWRKEWYDYCEKHDKPYAEQVFNKTSDSYLNRDGCGKGSGWETWSKRADGKYNGMRNHNAKDPTHKWERRIGKKKEIQKRLDSDWSGD